MRRATQEAAASSRSSRSRGLLQGQRPRSIGASGPLEAGIGLARLREDVAVEKVPTSAGDVSLAVDGDAGRAPLLVLGHGAGANMDSDFMVDIGSGLVEAGVATARFNFGYT